MKKVLEAGQEILIAAEYAAGTSSRRLAVSHSVSPDVILRAVRNAGGVVRKHTRTCDLNESAFDTSSEERDYFVGFLMADGNVSDRGDIKLTLASIDRPHVEQFRAFLGSSHAIRCRIVPGSPLVPRPHWACGISVRSRRLADALARFGVVPRKSKSAKVVGLEKSSAFWRGVIDGDGTYHPARPETTTGRKHGPAISLVGSVDLVSQFKEFVKSFAPRWDGQLLQRIGIHRLSVGGTVAAQLARVLHADATVYLPRKREAAVGIMSYCSSKRQATPRNSFTRDELVRLYEAHGTWYAVADSLGMNYESVGQLKRQLGVDPELRSRSGPRRRPVTADELTTLYEELGSWGAVAKRVGRSRDCLRQVRREFGMADGRLRT